MTLNGWLQIFFFLLIVLLITKPMGVFLARVFNREKTFFDPLLRPLERLLYRLTGVDENHEMRWTEYAIAMLLFSAQMIRPALQVEQNTRETSEACARLAEHLCSIEHEP